MRYANILSERMLKNYYATPHPMRTIAPALQNTKELNGMPPYEGRGGGINKVRPMEPMEGFRGVARQCSPLIK